MERISLPSKIGQYVFEVVPVPEYYRVCLHHFQSQPSNESTEHTTIVEEYITDYSEALSRMNQLIKQEKEKGMVGYDVINPNSITVRDIQQQWLDEIN